MRLDFGIPEIWLVISVLCFLVLLLAYLLGPDDPTIGPTRNAEERRSRKKKHRESHEE